MSDLADFLLTRYAEAETHAREVHERRCGTDPTLVSDPLGRPMPVECECDWHIVGVLADLAAKRRLVEQVSNVPWASYAVRDVVLGLLAEPFAEHEDFRPEWRV